MNKTLKFSVAVVTAAVALVAAAYMPAGAAPVDCSAWTLDGYRIGMTGEEMLAVRSVTLHVEGQAQVVVPGSFRGVLVLDKQSRLREWDVVYDARGADALRTEMLERLGAPVSDVSGDIVEARQRRMIWRSTACDAAILVYDTTSTDGSVHTVRATLARASALPHRIFEMKTLLP